MTDHNYYRFGDVEVIDITRHLTGNSAQVVQYAARSSRLDGLTKGEDLQDLRKARDFLDDEIRRREELAQKVQAAQVAKIIGDGVVSR